MKSFFASALASATSPKATADSEAIAAANAQLLSKAESTLHQLRLTQKQNFPLLNEATRLGKYKMRLGQGLLCCRRWGLIVSCAYITRPYENIR